LAFSDYFSQHINPKVVFYSQSAGEKLTNSVFLMAAYCVSQLFQLGALPAAMVTR